MSLVFVILLSLVLSIIFPGFIIGVAIFIAFFVLYTAIKIFKENDFLISFYAIVFCSISNVCVVLVWMPGWLKAYGWKSGFIVTFTAILTFLLWTGTAIAASIHRGVETIKENIEVEKELKEIQQNEQ